MERSALHKLPYAPARSTRLGPGQAAVAERAEAVDCLFEFTDHFGNGARLPLPDRPAIGVGDE